MCTAITYKTKDSYFGRNFDLEYSYEENVTITPRNYCFNRFENANYAIIGMAYIRNNYPLYYDAINEKGLGMAGLNFPYNARYFSENTKKRNIAPYEFIPYILRQCVNIAEAKECLSMVNLTNIDFLPELPVSPLHWIISDTDSSITVESVSEGLTVYDNPFGVLTNTPTFDMQMFNLNNFMHLTAYEPKNTFVDGLVHYSRGMGALGLPGDLSSQSRFVKAVFTKSNSLSGNDEEESISQFFHILSSVEQQRGCVRLQKGNEITLYSSCCNQNKGIYYYKTYDNSRISAVDMHRENLDRTDLISYPLIKKQDVFFQN